MHNSQDAVIDFLTTRETHGGAEVERIDTHLSSVFLAGDRVYKLKRAVRLSFVDFTRPETRRWACEREVRFNARGAPGIYLRCAAVTRDGDGRFALDGAGEPVDWVVEMRRFDRDTMFDRLAASGRLDRRLIQDLADRVAELHAEGEPAPEFGGARGLLDTVDGNAEAMAPFRDGPFTGAEVDRLATRTRQALRAVADLLDRRRDRGLVRRCHGDLHLRNVALHDGRPILFDCIEFEDAFACIDQAYDLAFLLMDLWAEGRDRLANIAFNQWLARTGDWEAAGPMPAMLSLRAAIRAHVEAAAADGQSEPDRAEPHREAARRYLDLAFRFLDPAPSRLVAVGGLSGSGKSRLGREIAVGLGRAPGAVVVRSDVLRKRLMNTPLHEKLPPAGYAPEMTERTYRAVWDVARATLDAGQAVVVDCVHARPAERHATEAVARDAGVCFDGFWLEAPAAVMAERVETRKGNVSDATAEVLDKQLNYDLGPVDWTRIDSSGPKAQTLEDARATLDRTKS